MSSAEKMGEENKEKEISERILYLLRKGQIGELSRLLEEKSEEVFRSLDVFDSLASAPYGTPFLLRDAVVVKFDNLYAPSLPVRMVETVRFEDGGVERVRVHYDLIRQRKVYELEIGGENFEVIDRQVLEKVKVVYGQVRVIGEKTTLPAMFVGFDLDSIPPRIPLALVIIVEQSFQKIEKQQKFEFKKPLLLQAPLLLVLRVYESEFTLRENREYFSHLIKRVLGWLEEGKNPIRELGKKLFFTMVEEHPILHEAVVLTLVSASRDTPPSMFLGGKGGVKGLKPPVRTWLNLLIIAGPATQKSFTGRTIARLVKSVFINAFRTSPAGYTGGVVGGRFRTGSVLQARGKVLVVDEFDKGDENLLKAMLDPLEAGEVVISLAGGQVSLPAPVSHIALMNPPMKIGEAVSFWDLVSSLPSKKRNILAPLLDRFDIPVAIPESAVRKEDAFDRVYLWEEEEAEDAENLMLGFSVLLKHTPLMTTPILSREAKEMLRKLKGEILKIAEKAESAGAEKTALRLFMTLFRVACAHAKFWTAIQQLSEAMSVGVVRVSSTYTVGERDILYAVDFLSRLVAHLSNPSSLDVGAGSLGDTLRRFMEEEKLEEKAKRVIEEGKTLSDEEYSNLEKYIVSEVLKRLNSEEQSLRRKGNIETFAEHLAVSIFLVKRVWRVENIRRVLENSSVKSKIKEILKGNKSLSEGSLENIINEALWKLTLPNNMESRVVTLRYKGRTAYLIQIEKKEKEGAVAELIEEA